jgi:hypothetical protein
LKTLGHARVEDARKHTELVSQIAELARHLAIERIFLIGVLSFDWNCPQYITPRYTAEKSRQSSHRCAPGSPNSKPKFHRRIEMNPRPPLPPFTEQTARQKVQAAEDA